MDRQPTPEEQGRLNRRTFFRAGLATAAGLIVAGITRRTPRHADAQLLETCIWENIQGPVCINHVKLYYRCLLCCPPCDYESCGWYNAGSC
jgi:hypothetical protein